MQIHAIYISFIRSIFIKKNRENDTKILKCVGLQTVLKFTNTNSSKYLGKQGSNNLCHL